MNPTSQRVTLRLGSGDPPKGTQFVRAGAGTQTPSQSLCVEVLSLGDPGEVVCPL